MNKTRNEEETETTLLDNSQVANNLRRLFGGDSCFSEWTNRLGTSVRGSFLYHWVTREPDPDIVVIELRETRTIGPFVKVFDWIVETADPYWRTSGLGRGVHRIATLGERILKTRFGRFLAETFEPPECDVNSPKNPSTSTLSEDMENS